MKIRARRLVSLLPAIALVVTASMAVPASAQSQVSEADSAAVLLQTATAFERDGRWEIAEALYVHIAEQYGGTAAAVEARARLSATPADRIERASRVELQVFGTLYGLWLGVAVPAAFGADGSEAYGAGLLIGGPLGLFSSRSFLRAHPLSEGQARAISWGGLWGTWQGGGWGDLLNLGGETICDPNFGCYRTDGGVEEVFASMVVGGLAGIVAGALVARHPVRSGVSSGAQGGSIWGSVYGAMAAGMFDADSEGGLATSLLVGNVGLLVGGALAAKYDVSRSRVRMINLGALMGGLGGLGIDLLIQPDEDPTLIAIPLFTSLLGLGIAIHSTRDNDRSAVEPSGEFSPALFGYGADGWRVGTPMPMPTLLPLEDSMGRTAWRPGVTLELFRARF